MTVRHLYPVDLVRVVTFACVIGVHTISTTHPLDSVPAGGAVILLHFTREAFFVLTAFVLTHRHRDDPPDPMRFWRRRLLLVGLPYLVWSALYTGLGMVTTPLPPAAAAEAFGHALVTGTAWYHLYFLLVAMQFYLLFPLFRALLRRTRGHHVALLAASAALQAGTDLWLHAPAPTGATAALLPYATSLLPSYQFFVVLGGVVALHLDDVEAWVRRHRVLVLVAPLPTGLAVEATYRWSIAHGASAQFAADVFQPVLIPWSVAVVAACFAVGTLWAERRARWPGSRLVEAAAARSFGVFLVHPAVLWLLTTGPDSPAARLHGPWETVVTYLAAVVTSLVFVELVRRTTLCLPLTGKPFRPRRPVPRTAPSADTHLAAPGTAATPGTTAALRSVAGEAAPLSPATGRSAASA